MAKKQTRLMPNQQDESSRLTPSEAGAIAETWIDYFCDDETIADLLLLLYSLAYEPEMLKRESIVMAIENRLMPYAPSLAEALRDLISNRLTAAHALIKEGGTQ